MRNRPNVSGNFSRLISATRTGGGPITKRHLGSHSCEGRGGFDLALRNGKLRLGSFKTLHVVWSARTGFCFPCQKREVRSMKTFEVQFRYRDRNEGTVESTVKVDASSLPGAVAKAAREFVKGLDRKQRFDMNKNGLEMTAKCDV